MTTPSFEQGPIRPPSEAHSLLVRVIRNCTWNRCTFCPVYKGTKASQRSLDEVLADVDAMAAAAQALGGPGAAADQMLSVLHAGAVPPEAMQVALFLRGGARHVFLQDADPCAVQPDKLVAILEHLRRQFPTITRVTTYGRAATIARRRPADLKRLVAAGLTRLHLGLESGADEVLAGRLQGGHIRGADRGRPQGADGRPRAVLLCHARLGRPRAERGAYARHGRRCCVPSPRPLPTSGRSWSRLRTTAVAPGTPLADRAAAGAFNLPDDVEVAAEVRSLIEQAGDARFELRSDHALNLLPELEGSLPADAARLLALLDEFLSLSPRERAEFALGARLGIYRRLADRHDARLRAVLEAQTRGLRPSLRRRAAGRGGASALALHLSGDGPDAPAAGAAKRKGRGASSEAPRPLIGPAGGAEDQPLTFAFFLFFSRSSVYLVSGSPPMQDHTGV